MEAIRMGLYRVQGLGLRVPGLVLRGLKGSGGVNIGTFLGVCMGIIWDCLWTSRFLGLGVNSGS